MTRYPNPTATWSPTWRLSSFPPGGDISMGPQCKLLASAHIAGNAAAVEWGEGKWLCAGPGLSAAFGSSFLHMCPTSTKSGLGTPYSSWCLAGSDRYQGDARRSPGEPALCCPLHHAPQICELGPLIRKLASFKQNKSNTKLKQLHARLFHY